MKNVIIYSTPTCVYCKMAKEFLTEKGIEFTDYDLSVDMEKREEVVKKTGQMAVPVIEVDGEMMVGFDKDKLSSLLGI
ncbi:MAG: Glutaredoxin-related protein [Parcubacteria group bacterium GW2011_GWB2_40_8]|nr:MAG: Glutaredoxin-related protein [Parcubacteria group bacterium GW2011_GWF2_40_10]KKR47229.1 MAG: Glutaredoxin-related protein [Parcubacteria group bacterium GW2011_GWA2_40_143]KKR60193.1 MAG: Glutaredoxin-related protein [Parcubacteria group bacterium GW2011_GWC2_40_31]KKR75058.1 MAG: Glutaredoxin-related protein [Parcubacteria group bacterium GW2011_GWB2_40_8]KKR77273.1 MAG: Glutaredoxin-related protein [Parcubacteria group bacterium GW2011_GWE2_40_8]KKR83407.1 MAG: Glutaredoxin-related 